MSVDHRWSVMHKGETLQCAIDPTSLSLQLTPPWLVDLVMLLINSVGVEQQQTFNIPICKCSNYRRNINNNNI